MPVGQGNQSFAGGLPTDAILLGHHIVLDERKHLVTITLGDEHLLVHVVVVGLRVAIFLVTLLSAAEGIQQTVVNNQTRSHNQELLRKSSALHILVSGIQHLPDQQGMHHPRLTCARSHLHSILRHLIFRLGKLSQVGPIHQFRDDALIGIHHTVFSHHFVQIDDVEDSLSLTLMEVSRTLVAETLSKPVVQERSGGWGHLLQHLPTLPGGIDHIGKSMRQFQRYIT